MSEDQYRRLSILIAVAVFIVALSLATYYFYHGYQLSDTASIYRGSDYSLSEELCRERGGFACDNIAAENQLRSSGLSTKASADYHRSELFILAAFTVPLGILVLFISLRWAFTGRFSFNLNGRSTGNSQ